MSQDANAMEPASPESVAQDPAAHGVTGHVSNAYCGGGLGKGRGRPEMDEIG
jgi:hypothetical protein